MTAILPSMKIDSDAQTSRYFMRHQLTWINDDSRMRLAEKSVRIGWTYADAFKNVRKRLHHKNRDYLFATKDAPSAFEYVDTCKKFCEIYKLTKSILDHGTDTIRVPVSDLKKDKGLTEEVKIGYIKFDNGSRIIAFSANPYAMQVYGGDVGLDEYARHPNAAALWETAQGRITWGYDIGVWSSHNGPDTQFNVFCQEAAAGKRGWSHYKVTMADAIDMGFLDKVFERTGRRWTKEEFLQDCLNRAGSQEIYDQSYDCQPRGSTSAIVPWTAIQLCSRDYSTYERAHIEEEQLKEKFGEFLEDNADQRRRQIHNWLSAHYTEHAARTARHTLGFDIAASGEGDLAAIYIDRAEGDAQRLSALLTFRTEDWDFIQTCLYWMMDHTSSVQGAGDETGLGRQICWNATKKFSGRFEAVNFATEKHDMGFALMNQLQLSQKQWPAEEKDIATDFFALRKLPHNGKVRFSEAGNQLNPHSHCDIAWAGALSTRASTQAKTGYSAVLI
jgi:phage FluMu gp28-like protein